MYGTELALTTLPARKPHFPETQDDKVKSLFFHIVEWFQKAKLTHERKPFMVTPAMSTLRREILRHSVRPVAASLSCQKGRSELVAVQTSSQAPPFLYY